MAVKALGPVRRKFAPWTDPAKKPLLDIRGVTKRFGSFPAVDDVSLAVHEREFFALLGPSGCGKTTLLRMIAGFEQPNAGHILLDGEDLVGVPVHKRPVNMMFQSYALFPHMNVEANVAFGLRQDGMPKAEIARRVEEMLELVKMTAFGKRKPDQLSGGQRQRVALARSLAQKPRLLLLDEPLAALDRKLREETQFELIELQMSVGLTFVIVTHDQEEAMTLADRIAVMKDGRLVQVATPAEIYEQPNCRYVADFVGDVNLIEGKIARLEPNAIEIECPSAGARILADHEMGTVGLGETVWFAVRPEKLAISREAPASPMNYVSGEVWDIGYLGDVSVYHVRLANGSTVRATIANRTRLVERPITWEDRVYLTWPRDAGLVLSR